MKIFHTNFFAPPLFQNLKARCLTEGPIIIADLEG